MSGVQFYTAELTPLQDGRYFVGLTATHVDETDLEFVNQDILSDRVPSVDIHQQMDPANVTHGVKVPLTQSRVVGLGFGAQSQEAGQ